MTKAIKPDQESLMALEALLKIRSQSMDGSATGSVSPQISSPTGIRTTKAIPRSLSQGAGMNQMAYSLPRSAQSYGVIPSTDSASSYMGGASSSFTPVVSSSASATHPAAISGIQQPLAPLHHESGQNKKRKTQAGEMDVAEASEGSQPKIRQEQIDAALRSKPQRGRKRENLSVLERLELTRTRNREHAKSTR